MDTGQLFDTSGYLNSTVVFALIDSYSSEELQMIMDTLNVTTLNELRQLLADSLFDKRSVSGVHFNANGTLDKASNPSDNDDRSAAQSLDDFAEYRLRQVLLLYVPPIFFIIGVVGNLLSFLILTRRPMRCVSTYRYLAALSLTDTLVLIVGLLRIWVGHLSGTDLADTAQWTCKLISVAGYTVSNYSVWLIVAVTVERYVVVCYPLLAPSLCQPGRSMRVIFAVFCVQLSIHIHFLWTIELRTTSSSGVNCEAAEHFETLINIVWPWVDTAIYSFLPFVIILVFNVLIVRKVFTSRRDRTTMCHPSTSAGNKMADSGKKLTVMLLSVSFTFLITTVPMNTILIVTSLWRSPSDDSVVENSVGIKLLLFRTITELLMYINHSTNFFLYCATGHKFRLQLTNMFCARRRQRMLASQHHVSTDCGNKRLQNNELICLADV